MSNYSAADRGGYSAWKGFSSQTVYIAYRLIVEKDNLKKYFPESIEDLKIVDSEDSIIELVQIKNLSSDLSLSDLNPNHEGGFLKRVLYARQQNKELLVRLVSFGDVGPELLRWTIESGSDLPDDSISNKLKDQGYSEEDMKWLRTSILIKKENEDQLKQKIFDEFNSNIETIVSPNVCFDVLINYVAELSRHQKSTSKLAWQEKTRAISMGLASISGWKNQFGKTILPLSEYQNFSSDDMELQRKAYNNGVNALPQHIQNDFDIRRPYWLKVLREHQDANSITILHGASGQGKSSLAYRYLIDNYTDNEIFIVSGIANMQQAIDISAALRELYKNEYNLIVYIDVRPYDRNWVWLIEQIYMLNLKVPVLVTIREEDFNRNPIDRNHIQFNDIELVLNETEAQELYNRYGTDKHISFADSWKDFGEHGLLMEYIFFLRENESLKNRLRNQIEKIILNEENSDNWLLALLIISYAGRKEVPINSKKLLDNINVEKYLRMMEVFNKEYLVKNLDDNISLGSLHPVRALLLSEILFNKLLADEESILLQVIQCMDYYPQTLLIDFFYRKSVSTAFVNSLSDISYTTWASYAGIIESLLWLSVWQYYNKHKRIIGEGNALTNNTFVFLMMTDITGYYKLDTSLIIDVFKKKNPERIQKIEGLLQKVEEKSINYCHVDNFMKQTVMKLPFKDELKSDALTYCGFALFWHAQRGSVIEESFFNDAIEHIDYSDVLSACELALGIQCQRWTNHYHTILNKIKPILAAELNIAYLDDTSNILQAYVINDVSSPEDNYTNNTKVMLAVDALRLLYFEKAEYHVTLIGTEIIKGIPVIDNAKTIKNERLPFQWITRLNGWFNKIDEYDRALRDWKDVYDYIRNTRREFCEISDSLCKAIDYYFKRQNCSKFVNEEYQLKESSFKQKISYYITPPKCAMNKYGIRDGISYFTEKFSVSENNNKSNHKSNVDESTDNVKRPTNAIIKTYFDYVQDIQNFLNQKGVLIIDKFKRADISNQGRLSYVNLMFALQKYPQMASLFDVFFNKYVQEEGCWEREKTSIFLLGAMWEYLYKVPLREENSVLYNKKREINQKKDIISNLIEKGISSIPGVLKVVYPDNREIFILLDVLHAESFVTELYRVFSGLFTDFEYATWDYAYVALMIQRINVQYAYCSKPTLGGFQVNVMDFTKNEDGFSANVKRSALGFDNYYWPISPDKTRFVLTIIGLIDSFSLVSNHINDVLSYFNKMKDEACVIKSTIDTWKARCNSIAKDIFAQITRTSSQLMAYLDGEEQKAVVEKFDKLTRTINDIDDLLLNLAVNSKEVEEKSILAEYKEAFLRMTDMLLND